MKKYITPPSLTTGFSAKGKLAKKRFANILDTRIRRGGLLAVILTVILVLACGGCIAGSTSSELAAGTDPINIIIAGEDSEGRNDAVLICELSEESLRITQLPRNTWVRPEHMLKQLSFEDGYYELDDVFGMIYEVTGVKCERYVSVNYEGLRNIIDSMGGVDFEVPVDMEYDDPYQELHISLKAGMQHLDGFGAEQVMRYLKGNPDSGGVVSGYEEGDLGRLKTQKKLYEAIGEKLLNDGVSNKLIKTIQNNVRSNLSYADMAAIAGRAAGLDKDSIDIRIAEGSMQTTENGVFYITAVHPE